MAGAIRETRATAEPGGGVVFGWSYFHHDGLFTSAQQSLLVAISFDQRQRRCSRRLRPVDSIFEQRLLGRIGREFEGAFVGGTGLVWIAESAE